MVKEAKTPSSGTPAPVENGSIAVNNSPTTPRSDSHSVAHANSHSHSHSPNTPPSHSHSPSPQPYYPAPPPQQAPQGSMPMYAPPYQYSTPPYAFTPGFYPPQPPVYIPPWQQQPFQYYPSPPPGVPHIWPPENHNRNHHNAHHNADNKRTPPPQHSVPIPPHILMQQQQHQQHQHPSLQHQQFYSSPQAHHSRSYAFAVSGHEHKGSHDSAAGGGIQISRMQSPPHKQRNSSSGRRRSGGPTTFNATPNGLGHGHSSNPNSANSTPSKGRPPSRAPPLKSDLEEIVEAARNLATSAKAAVSSGDEVTLTLQLTSWASSLEEAQKHQKIASSTGQVVSINNGNGNSNGNDNQRSSVPKKFDAIFRASHALEIVSESILFMDIPADSAVHKALVSLYGFVLYGDETMHRSLADEARKLRDALGTESSSDSTLSLLVKSLEKNLVLDPILGSPSLTYKQAAVYKVLRVLRDVADDVAAYNDILPKPPQNAREGALENSLNHSPAGPDPTKVVERSMDSWRRACARLQGEMAIIVVLEVALVSIDEQLAAPSGSPDELVQFFASVSSIVKSRLKMDIEQRNQTLRESWWTHVATSDANSVFEAVNTRALAWHGLFQTGLSDVEAQLNNIGLGFGPAARVSEDKVPALVNCSAGVAALTSTHNHGLDWCKETAKVLTGMSVAFAALSQTHGGSYGPPEHLVESFIEGMNRASDAIFGVQSWSFDSVYEKILGSLEKSVDVHNNTNTSAAAPTKTKGIRFEEPERTEMVRNLSMESQDDGKGTEGGSQKRRKPRHARMKSSPDELLHLGAHLEVPNRETINGDDEGESVDVDSTPDTSPQKTTPSRNTRTASTSPTSLVTCISEGDEANNSFSTATEIVNVTIESKAEGERKGELAVVYEEKLLEFEDDEEEDRHIVVRDDVEIEVQVAEDEANGRKKSHHSRSMSVDGIPFGV